MPPNIHPVMLAGVILGVWCAWCAVAPVAIQCVWCCLPVCETCNLTHRCPAEWGVLDLAIDVTEQMTQPLPRQDGAA